MTHKEKSLSGFSRYPGGPIHPCLYGTGKSLVRPSAPNLFYLLNFETS